MRTMDLLNKVIPSEMSERVKNACQNCKHGVEKLIQNQRKKYKPNTLAVMHEEETEDEEETLSHMLESTHLKERKSSKEYSALHKAVGHNDVQEVQMLLEKGVDTECINAEKQTPLLVACEKGYTYLAMILLKHGANFNCKGKNNQTPLHYAAKHGYMQLVEELVKYPIDLNSSDTDNRTALHISLENKHTTIAKLLIKLCSLTQVDRKGNTILHYAVEYQNCDIVRELVKILDVNAKRLDGVVPMHLAVKHDNAEILNILQEAGGDCTIQDNRGYTLHHYMVRNDDMKCWNTLKEMENVLPNETKNIYSESFTDLVAAVGKAKFLEKYEFDILSYLNSLYIARENNNTDVMEYLLKQRLSKKQAISQFPAANLMNTAITYNFISMFRCLYKYGLSLNNIDGEISALEKSAILNRKDIIQIMLEGGENIYVLNKDKRTLLHLAALSGSTEVAKLLMKNGINLEAKDRFDRTALHLASHGEHLNCINFLLKAGANKNVKDVFGESPFDLASSQEVKMILK